MKALILNCTLKASPATSNTGALASPTWLARPSSVAQRVLERMDAMLSEQDEEGQPVAYDDEAREWSDSTGETAAANLHAAARALAASPIPAASS